jgi:uncharacterized surface protein with fasciclin (FAS1) repeats
MKIVNINKSVSLILLCTSLFFTACNKVDIDPVSIKLTEQATTPTLSKLLDNSDSSFTFFKAAVTKAGMQNLLNDVNSRYTIFAPTNSAFILSGIPSVAAINALPTATVEGLVSYHIAPQIVLAQNISETFPNYEYPTFLNPTTGTPSFNPLLRLTNFPSKRGTGAWVNNIPITDVNVNAVNGVLHKVYTLVQPPTKYLWDSIALSRDLTYLKAAIIRADSGVTVQGRLQTALSSFGANLTVLAPTNLAFQTMLTGAIYKALTGQGMPAATAYPTAQYLASTPDVFSNPALYGALSAQTVKGIVVYHILGTSIPGIRVFSVNLPTTATPIKTFLNGVIATHPGLLAQATFAGSFVSAATFKGAANTTASKVIINPLNPLATDQNYVNGVIMKIDQVLLPQ